MKLFSTDFYILNPNITNCVWNLLYQGNWTIQRFQEATRGIHQDDLYKHCRKSAFSCIERPHFYWESINQRLWFLLLICISKRSVLRLSIGNSVHNPIHDGSMFRHWGSPGLDRRCRFAGVLWCRVDAWGILWEYPNRPLGQFSRALILFLDNLHTCSRFNIRAVVSIHRDILYNFPFSDSRKLHLLTNNFLKSWRC